MDSYGHHEEGVDVHANRCRSSRLARVQDFNPGRRRLPQIVSIPQTITSISNSQHLLSPGPSTSSTQTVIAPPHSERVDDLDLGGEVTGIHDPMFMIARRPYVALFPSHDCGHMDLVCPHCGALHWKNERAAKSPVHSPLFSLCCSKGKICVPLLNEPPSVLRDLYTSQFNRAKDFRRNIVLYNRALAFMSLGIKQDHSVNNRRGCPIFRVQGELKHWSGTLLPAASQTPTYAQLYIYDPDIDLIRHRLPQTVARNARNNEVVSQNHHVVVHMIEHQHSGAPHIHVCLY